MSTGAVGIIFGAGGVTTGLIMAVLTQLAVRGLLPLIPPTSADYGLVYQGLHWVTWLFCIWPAALSRRGFWLASFVLHFLALLMDAAIVLWQLSNLLTVGLAFTLTNLWALILATLLLILCVVTLVSLRELYPRDGQRAPTHVDGAGFVFAFGGVFAGIFMLLATIVGIIHGFAVIPPDPASYGLIYHGLHWIAWLPCLWTGPLKNRGFLLTLLIVHLILVLNDAGIYAWQLAAPTTTANSVWAGLLAGVFIILSTATLASLITYASLLNVLKGWRRRAFYGRQLD